MKKLLFFIVSIYLISFIYLTPTKIVKADSEKYMRVLSNGVYIYSDSNFENKLFEIPYGYYVKVENVNGNTARVTYGSNDENYPVIMGYSKVSELTEIDYTPTKPFIVIKVSTSFSDVLFNDPNLSKAYFNVPENTFMYYYGEYKTVNGNNFCYVYCNNKLGYFDKLCLNPFTVPNSPDVITPPENSESKEPDLQEENEKTSPLPAESLQIIIIVGLSVISISIVYYLFKPSKQKTEKEFFNEE